VAISPITAHSPKPKGFPFGKLCFGLAIVTATGLGIFLGRYAPLTAFDWLGLLQGRKLEEVFIEGLATRLDRPYQILVMGIDRVPNLPPSDPASFDGRSDTMLLIRFDPVTKTVNLLSIPRDTLVDIGEWGRQKVNSANVFGGADLAKTVVSRTLNNVQIDRYLRLDTNSIVDLVDALGGVEVNVPERMLYSDKTQKLEIDLYPGVQVLNGKQAEGFVRYRGGIDADIGRIKRQQIMLRAIKAKLSDPLVVTRLPDLIGVVQKHLNTDLNFDEMLAIASFALSLKPDQVRMTTLAGRPSEIGEFNSSYWLSSPEEIDGAIDGKFVTQN
jgi:LCP family protein required for cell wall assembly